jgi:ribosome-binding protein aMBF1 (putative translation factor)
MPPIGMAGNRPRVICRDVSTFKSVNVKVQKKTTRSADAPTSLDNFLKEDGNREFEAVAMVLAWQIATAMKAQNLSRKRLAERMKTSRSQIGRLLDPQDGNVTLATLQRAARMLGRTLKLELV